jgi:transcription antitermination factor NusG
MEDASIPQWYAIFVRPHCEESTVNHLKYLGEETFLPRHETNQKAPLFPGYIFCRTVLHKAPKLYSVRGVIRILGNRTGPIALTVEEIDLIKCIHKCGLRVQTHPLFEPQQTVKLQSGPLRGISGSVMQSSDHERFIVSIPLLMRTVSVRVDLAWLQPA